MPDWVKDPVRHARTGRNGRPVGVGDAGPAAAHRPPGRCGGKASVGYGSQVASWGSTLTGLVPLSLVISLSPLSVIPAVLVLHSPRPRPTSLAFLAGWVLGLTALTVGFVAGSGALGDLHKSPPAWASWSRIVLGAALIAFGIYQWLTRHRHSEMPGWMRSFTKLTPPRSGAAGMVLVVVRLEVLLVCAAAGLAIGSAGLGDTRAWISAAFFVVLSASSVAAPVLAYTVAGDRLEEPLTRLQDWMERNHAALVAAVLVLIGVMVLYNGIHAL